MGRHIHCLGRLKRSMHVHFLEVLSVSGDPILSSKAKNPDFWVVSLTLKDTL